MEAKIELIDCPCCGKKVSNHAASCPHCGHPIKNYESEVNTEKESVALPKRRCVNCGCENSIDARECEHCKRVFEYGGFVTVNPVQDNRDLFVTNKNVRLCPKCGGTNYHAFVEEKVIREGKVKSKTTLNLNPLKPFTVFNHKEKVVRKPITTQVSKFVCDDCGKIFR